MESSKITKSKTNNKTTNAQFTKCITSLKPESSNEIKNNRLASMKKPTLIKYFDSINLDINFIWNSVSNINFFIKMIDKNVGSRSVKNIQKVVGDDKFKKNSYFIINIAGIDMRIFTLDFKEEKNYKELTLQAEPLYLINAPKYILKIVFYRLKSLKDFSFIKVTNAFSIPLSSELIKLRRLELAISLKGMFSKLTDKQESNFITKDEIEIKGDFKLISSFVLSPCLLKKLLPWIFSRLKIKYMANNNYKQIKELNKKINLFKFEFNFEKGMNFWMHFYRPNPENPKMHLKEELEIYVKDIIRESDYSFIELRILKQKFNQVSIWKVIKKPRGYVKVVFSHYISQKPSLAHRNSFINRTKLILNTLKNVFEEFDKIDMR